MTSRSLLARIALGALALGVFVSCASKEPEEEFPQDRLASGIYVVPANMDPSWLAQHPDSSGWRLRWSLPLSTDGIQAVWIFGDSLRPDQASKLFNGKGSPDMSGMPALLAKLAGTDTSWSIPSSRFSGAQGKAIPLDTFRFAVWIQYGSGPTPGTVPYSQLFLGDDIKPAVPTIRDSAGQTSILLAFSRPKDQANYFDTGLTGRISSIRAVWWKGRSAADSAGSSRWTSVPSSQVSDTSMRSFRLLLDGLSFHTRYCYALVVADSAGNVSRSEVFQATTMDSLAPSAPTDLRDAKARTDSVAFSWSAATDTFDRSGAPLRSAFPNYDISRYVVRIDGRGVDSMNLDPANPALFSPDSSFGTETSRFSWSGGRWTWYWREFRPGGPWKFEVLAYDASGNVSATAQLVDSTSLASPAPGSCEAGWIPVAGTGTLASYCIEEREHRSGKGFAARVTWAQAIAACSAVGAELCSEAQWIRSCETFPNGTGTIPYGAVGVGELAADTGTWLQSNCQLGTGDSASMMDTSIADSRCVSGWGVRDLPGRLGEWTRDVYRSSDTVSGVVEARTLAFLGASDVTGKADLGTIHGGSALVLDQSDRTLSTARCRTRNYPASSAIDTIRDASGRSTGVRQRPLPEGASSAWGFRCCRLVSP